MEVHMARNQNQPQSNDRPKVRIFYGEADGSSQSIQDLVRLLSAVVRPPQHVIQPNQTTVLPALSPPAQVVPVEERPLFEGLEDGTPAVDEVTSLASEADGKQQRRRRGEGPKVSRNASIQLVSGLDFLQQDKQPLKEFFAEKSPKTDMEQILAFAFYMQEVMELQDFGPGHILSAYKHIGNLTVPLDLKGTLRNMKRQKGWLTFTDMDHIRVDTEGENYVKTELGREKVKPR
jgi:hypothetical protein